MRGSRGIVDLAMPTVTGAFSACSLCRNDGKNRREKELKNPTDRPNDSDMPIGDNVVASILVSPADAYPCDRLRIADLLTRWLGTRDGVTDIPI